MDPARFSPPTSFSSSLFLLFLFFSSFCFSLSSASLDANQAAIDTSNHNNNNEGLTSEFKSSIDLPSSIDRHGGAPLNLDISISSSLDDSSSSSTASEHMTTGYATKHKFFSTGKGMAIDIRLAYDTDSDEYVSVAVIDRNTNGPFHGSLYVADRNAAILTYTPSRTYTGKDSFVCELCRTRDGKKVCSQIVATVAIQIEAVDDQVSTAVDHKVEFSLLTNDDPLADVATLVIASPPRHGDIVSSSGIYKGSDSVTYKPDHGFVGFDSFEYEVCQDEARDNCGRAVVNISVKPRAMHDEFEVTSRVSSKLNVLTNDVGYSMIDPRTVQVTAEPEHGIIVSVDPKSGEITYLPSRNFAGEDAFYYTVCSKEIVDDETSLLKMQQLAESALEQVSVVFERYRAERGKDASHEHERFSHPNTRATNKDRPMAKDDDPTSMEQVSSWFSGSSADDVDRMNEQVHAEHSSNLQDQLVHFKSVEVFSRWLTNHEFYCMKRANVGRSNLHRDETNATLGEWDVVIVEVSDSGKDVYGDIENEIEATVSQIFAQDLSYLEEGRLDSGALAQWLWNKHRGDVEEIVQRESNLTLARRRVCADPVRVSLSVQLWAKDDHIRVKEGSTTDVVVLANDHTKANPTTLRVMALPSGGGKVEVVQKGTYAVLRYATPMGFYGQDNFEYQVCTDESRRVCGRARVVANVEHYAVMARNDYFRLPYNPQLYRVCPLANDAHADHSTIKLKRDSDKGATLELEEDEQGQKTGCVLYTARSHTDSGMDSFHYEVCGGARGCVQAQVRVDVACSYFDRDPEEVAYLLLRQVNSELITSISSTLESLAQLKALSQEYDARTSTELTDDILQWNRELKGFCKFSLTEMNLVQSHILSVLNSVAASLEDDDDY